MPKQSLKTTFALVLGLAVPVLALTGCPIPGFPGTSPSATLAPTTAPTPARTTGVVIAKVDFPAGDVSTRAVTLKNLGTAEVDTSKYLVSYEYDDAGTLKMQHLRIAGGKKIAAGGTLTFKDSTSELTDAGLGGTSADKMGLQLGHGSLVIYKDVNAAADIKAANIADYLQYGTAKSYTHAVDAVTAKVWDSKDSYAAAPTSLGQSLNAKVAGNVGSGNWEAK